MFLLFVSLNLLLVIFVRVIRFLINLFRVVSNYVAEFCSTYSTAVIVVSIILAIIIVVTYTYRRVTYGVQGLNRDEPVTLFDALLEVVGFIFFTFVGIFLAYYAVDVLRELFPGGTAPVVERAPASGVVNAYGVFDIVGSFIVDVVSFGFIPLIGGLLDVLVLGAIYILVYLIIGEIDISILDRIILRFLPERIRPIITDICNIILAVLRIPLTIIFLLVVILIPVGSVAVCAIVLAGSYAAATSGFIVGVLFILPTVPVLLLIRYLVATYVFTTAVDRERERQRRDVRNSRNGML